MKKIKLSFLYFCLLLGCFWSKKVRAQQVNDSLSYYYNLYIESKEGSDLFKVYNFYGKHKEFSLQKKDTLNAVYDLRFIASIQYKIGRYHESDATGVSALELIKKMVTTPETIEAKIGLLNHLGIVSYELKNYNRALQLYDRVLKIVQTNNQKNIVYNNKANVYKKKNNYDLAKVEFTKVYLNNLKLGNILETARSLDNLGLVKSKLNNEDGLKNMLDALKIRQTENNFDEIFVSYKHLAEYFADRNDIKRVKYYANKAYDLAVTVKNVSYKLESLSLLLNLDASYKVKEYRRLTDSIAVAKQVNENKFASMKYDFSEEKRKAEEAKLKLIKSQLAEEKQKQLKLLYLISTLFILFMAILLYFILRSRHKKEELLQVYKTETRISVKVHDEVANDVYHIITKLQDNATVNEDVLDDLEKVYNKTRDISRENSTINLEANFNEIVNDLLVSYKNNEINIITKNSAKINWKRVSKEKKTIIYRVLQELMTNMKKHSKASLVVVTFTQENKLVIKYSDNGIGTENKTHNGLQNAENRINSVNGTISFDSHSGKGFKATITI